MTEPPSEGTLELLRRDLEGFQCYDLPEDKAVTPRIVAEVYSWEILSERVPWIGAAKARRIRAWLEANGYQLLSSELYYQRYAERSAKRIAERAKRIG